MLTALEMIGSSKELGTDGIAAWCNTNRTSCMAFRQVSRDRMSPCTNSIAPLTGSRLSSWPVARLSNTRIRCPLATSAWTRLEPIKPAPPVIRYIDSLSQLQADLHVVNQHGVNRWSE